MLTDKDLYLINGGAIKISIGFVVGAIVTLIVGIIDGYLRPLKCN